MKSYNSLISIAKTTLAIGVELAIKLERQKQICAEPQFLRLKLLHDQVLQAVSQIQENVDTLEAKILKNSPASACAVLVEELMLGIESFCTWCADLHPHYASVLNYIAQQLGAAAQDVGSDMFKG